MELVNEIYRLEARGLGRPGGPALREALETLVLLLNPFTPHVCEEMWAAARPPRGASSAHPWPVFDAEAAREDAVELAVQVNGKVRGRVAVRAGRVRGRDPGAGPGGAPRGRAGAGQADGEARGRARPPRQHGGEVRRREVLAAAAGRSCPGCGYALQGRGITTDAIDQEDRRAALQGPHREARPRLARHAGGDRGAAEARPLHGREGRRERGRRRRGRHHVLQRGARELLAPTPGTTQATRYAISLTASVVYRKVGQKEPIWANDAFSQRDEYDMGENAQNYFDREMSSRSSGSPRPSRAASWPPCSRRSSPGWRAPPAPRRSRRSSGRTPTSPRRPSSGSWPPRSARTARTPCRSSTATRRSGRTCWRGPHGLALRRPPRGRGAPGGAAEVRERAGRGRGPAAGRKTKAKAGARPGRGLRPRPRPRRHPRPDGGQARPRAGSPGRSSCRMATVHDVSPKKGRALRAHVEAELRARGLRSRPGRPRRAARRGGAGPAPADGRGRQAGGLRRGPQGHHARTTWARCWAGASASRSTC